MNNTLPFMGTIVGMPIAMIEAMAITKPALRPLALMATNAPAVLEQRRKLVRDAEIDMLLKARAR